MRSWRHVMQCRRAPGNWILSLPTALPVVLLRGFVRRFCFAGLAGCTVPVPDRPQARTYAPNGQADKRNFITLLFARPARDPPHHPGARCARSDHPPHASFRPRKSCPGRFEAPRLVSPLCANSAHEGSRSGEFGIPSGARRSIERTQLWWGRGTHPPRRSARRHTTTAASPTARALCSKAPTPSSMEFGTRARAANTAAEFRGSVLWHPVPRPSDRVPPRVWCTVSA